MGNATSLHGANTLVGNVQLYVDLALLSYDCMDHDA
jgi:hypothetical protein